MRSVAAPDANQTAGPREGDGEQLARVLSGDLRCIRCGYDLGGLSVRSGCPECGTPVVATVLSVVDPLASELRPLSRPRVVSASLIAIVGGAFAALVLVWLARGMELAEAMGHGLGRPQWMAVGSTVLLAASVVATLGVVHPHEGFDRRKSLAAGLGVLLLVPAAYYHGMIQIVHDAFRGSGMFDPSGMGDTRLLWRGGICLASGCAVLLLRPSVRSLLARSVVLRTGSRARQPLLPISVALFVVAGADGLTLAARRASGAVDQVVSMAGPFLVGLAGVMLLMALAGLLRDVIKLAPVLLRPAPGPGEVIGHG